VKAVLKVVLDNVEVDVAGDVSEYTDGESATNVLVVADAGEEDVPAVVAVTETGKVVDEEVKRGVTIEGEENKDREADRYVEGEVWLAEVDDSSVVVISGAVGGPFLFPEGPGGPFLLF